MGKTLRSWLRRLLCPHWARVIKMRPVGVTLSWGGRLTTLFEWTRTCGHCGQVRKTRGILPAWSKTHSIYQPKGVGQWPVDPNTGERLPRAP